MCNLVAFIKLGSYEHLDKNFNFKNQYTYQLILFSLQRRCSHSSKLHIYVLSLSIEVNTIT